MHMTITHFKIDERMSLEELVGMFEGSAPRYAAVPGLLSKQYYIDDGGRGAGGVYLWETRERADAFFDEAFQQSIAQRLGSLPTLTSMHCPVWLDNVHQTQRKG